MFSVHVFVFAWLILVCKWLKIGEALESSVPSLKKHRQLAPSQHLQTQIVTVVGPGAIGSFYGARLSQSKQHPNRRVTFFSPRKESEHIVACRENGLYVNSVVHSNQVVRHTRETFFTSKVEDLEHSDWIVVALKGTEDGLESLDGLLPKLIRPDGTSRVVTVMNGLVDRRIMEKIGEGGEGRGV